MPLSQEMKVEWERRIKALTVQELMDQAGVGQAQIAEIVEKLESNTHANRGELISRLLPNLIRRLKFLDELDGLAAGVAHLNMEEQGLI